MSTPNPMSPPPPPAAPAPASPPPPPPAANAYNWEGASDEQKGYVSNKGWKDPIAAVQSYIDLEKVFGHDKAGRTIVLPKDETDGDGWGKVHSKLGRPDKPDGYTLADAAFKDDPFVKKFAEDAHKLGFSDKQFGAAMGTLAQIAQQVQAKESADFIAKSETEARELSAAWGKDYDRNYELARKTANMFAVGETPDQKIEFIDKIIGAVGYRAAHQFLASVGAGFGEHKFVDGGNNPNPMSMTKEGARVRIGQLKKDAEFQKKRMNGDAEANLLWNRLHEAGHGG